MPFQFVVNKNGHCRLCNEPDAAQNVMVACDECDRWFHLQCAGIKHRPAASERWIYGKCAEIEIKIKDLEAMSEKPATNAQEGTSDINVVELMKAHERNMADLIKSFNSHSLKKETTMKLNAQNTDDDSDIGK